MSKITANKVYKKLLSAILFTLLFVSCKRMPVETETRIYELTYIDGKTEVYTFYNVEVNASEGINHSFGGYYFYLISPSKTYAPIEAIIRYKRLK